MSDSDKARENYQRYCYARDGGHLDYVKKAKKCNDFVVGRHWRKEVERSLAAQGKPILTINKVLSTLATIEGEQIQSQFDIGFRPLRGGANFETADALNGVWLSIGAANGLPWQIIDVFDAGARTSRGFFDVRVDFDDNWMGEVRITTPNPRNIVIDPDADSIDPDTWNEVFITKWLSPLDIESTYALPGIAKELEGRDRSYYLDGLDSLEDMRLSFGAEPASGHYDTSSDDRRRRSIRVVERQFRETKIVPHFVNPVTGDIRPVPDTWDRERIGAHISANGLAVVSRKRKVVKWLTSAEEFVLKSEDSPLKHLTIVPFFPYFFDGDTVGLVENSISSQELLNKVTSQELHVVNTTANSGWQMTEDQLANMTAEELEQKGAMTGLVIVRKANTEPLEKIQPNQVPTGLDRIGYKAEEFLKETMNVSDSQRGFDRADVAAKAIDTKRAAGAVSQMKPYSNMLRALSMVARNALDIIQAYYTEERLVFVTGGAGSDDQEAQELVVNQVTPEGRVANDLTLGEYEVVTVLVPPRDSLDDTVFQEAKDLRLEMGIAIPDEFMIEASRLPRKNALLRMMREQAANDANAAAQELAQLEVELKKLEIQEKQAKIMETKASAALSVMRAKRDGAEMASGGQAEAQQAEEAALREMVIDREKMRAELQMQRERMEAEIELAREKAQAEIKLKRATAAVTSQIAEENAATQREVMAKNAEAQRKAQAKAAAAKPKAAAK